MHVQGDTAGRSVRGEAGRRGWDPGGGQLGLFLQILFVAPVARTLQLMKSLCKTSVRCGLRSAKVDERVGTRRILAEYVAKADAIRGILMNLFQIFRGLRESIVEDALLDSAHSAEAPGGADELFEQCVFGGSARLVFVLKGFGKLVEGVLVFGIEEKALGGEALGHGVVAEGGASFGGARAGAFLGIAAIGVKLLLGWH